MIGSFRPLDVKTKRSFEIVCHAMLTPRKFMQRRKKVEIFKDAADEAEQKNWRKLMKEIEELGSAVPILKTQRAKMDALPRDLVLGTLVRFKQLKKWGLVSEVLVFPPHFTEKNYYHFLFSLEWIYDVIYIYIIFVIKFTLK